MGLETGDYISDLVATNPAGSDERKEGDDHLRLIKHVLKTTFANFNGATDLSSDEASALSALNPALETILTIASVVLGMTKPLVARLTDAGAAAGPTLALDRVSSSAAAADELGEILFRGNNDNATPELITFMRAVASIVDKADGSEDGKLILQSMIAGALTTTLALQQGLTLGGATGGDQGLGLVNAKGFFVDGVRQSQVLKAGAMSGGSFTCDDIPSWVNDIEVVFNMIPVDDINTIFVTPRKSAGTDITASSGVLLYGDGATAASSLPSANQAIILGSSVKNTANSGGLSVRLMIFGIQSSTHKKAQAEVTVNQSGTTYVVKHGWRIADTAVLTGVKITTSSGGVSGGTARVIGHP